MSAEEAPVEETPPEEQPPPPEGEEVVAAEAEVEAEAEEGEQGEEGEEGEFKEEAVEVDSDEDDDRSFAGACACMCCGCFTLPIVLFLIAYTEKKYACDIGLMGWMKDNVVQVGCDDIEAAKGKFVFFSCDVGDGTGFSPISVADFNPEMTSPLKDRFKFKDLAVKQVPKMWQCVENPDESGGAIAPETETDAAFIDQDTVEDSEQQRPAKASSKSKSTAKTKKGATKKKPLFNTYKKQWYSHHVGKFSTKDADVTKRKAACKDWKHNPAWPPGLSQGHKMVYSQRGLAGVFVLNEELLKDMFMIYPHKIRDDPVNLRTKLATSGESANASFLNVLSNHETDDVLGYPRDLSLIQGSVHVHQRSKFTSRAEHSGRSRLLRSEGALSDAAMFGRLQPLNDQYVKLGDNRNADKACPSECLGGSGKVRKFKCSDCSCALCDKGLFAQNCGGKVPAACKVAAAKANGDDLQKAGEDGNKQGDNATGDEAPTTAPTPVPAPNTSAKPGQHKILHLNAAGDAIVSCKEEPPNYGCMKIQYFASTVKKITYIGKIDDEGAVAKTDTPATWNCKTQKKWWVMPDGAEDLDTYISDIEKLTFNTVVITRIILLLLCWWAVYCCFQPISYAADLLGDLLDLIPVVGDFLEDLLEGVAECIVCTMSCTMGCSCGLFVLAFVWVAMRPKVGIPLMIVICCCCGFTRKIREQQPEEGRKRKRQKKKAKKRAAQIAAGGC